MQSIIPSSWQALLIPEVDKFSLQSLLDRVQYEYANKTCFPEEKNIFRALDITPFEEVKVVILGQDPYHTPGAAMGLAFSIPNGSPMQPSLRNIFKELESDIGVKRENTDLIDWAKQGILLLNSVLTVCSGEPASHSDFGWETFTDTIIRILSEKRDGIVFVLWGNYAISKAYLIDSEKHCIIRSSHPSPFSAYRGFFGSRPFSRSNEYLVKNGKTEIIWG